MTTYPPAEVDPIAQTYGPLDDRTALVLHTTETRTKPGYRLGKVAPHFEYYPRYRTWRQMAPVDQRVGTMRGSATTGIRANEKAIQCEIVAYSNRAAAEQVGGIWVGDFTDQHYTDIADFVAWARTEGLCGPTVTPTPSGGFVYGTSSPHRMHPTHWAVFTGLTCHGAVPGQTHWDTGVLDLQRISNEGDTVMFTTWANGLFDHVSDSEIIDLGYAGYWQPGGNQTIEEGADYWITLRDLGAHGRTTDQRKEVARFIQTCQVSSWLNTAKEPTP